MDSSICRSITLSVHHFATVPTVDRAAWSDRTLANGLRVILHADEQTANVAVAVAFHVGGKDDPAGRSGFAHLFEHLMFKGTETTPAETLDRLTEDVGGFNNAYTSADLTVYYEVVPANYLETIIWAEADRLSSLRVDAENFRTERDVVIGEYDQRVLAEPYGKLDEFVEEQLFSGHAYAQGVIGDPESLRAASLEHVLAFHKTYYRPDNAVVAIVGNFDLAETERWIDRYFGVIAKPAGQVPRPPPFTPPATPVRRSYQAANVPLTALNLAFYAPAAADRDGPYIDILEFVLGAGRSSRLHQALIHKTQLASHVSTESDLREQAGVMHLRALLHNDADRARVEAILLAECERMCTELITDAELSRARNQLATMVVRHNESMNNRSLAYVSDAILRGNPRQVEADMLAYGEATPADIRRVANLIFSVGPAIYEYRSSQ